MKTRQATDAGASLADLGTKVDTPADGDRPAGDGLADFGLGPETTNRDSMPLGNEVRSDSKEVLVDGDSYPRDVAPDTAKDAGKDTSIDGGPGNQRCPGLTLFGSLPLVRAGRSAHAEAL